MADNVKDLVVRLSFEHGDTKSQIAAIKNELKLLDSGFQAAASAAGGFSGKLNESGGKSQLLRQQIALQEQAIRKYGQAIDQAQQRLQAAQQRQQDYTSKLADAKQKHADLTGELKQHKSAMKELADLGQKGTAAYAEEAAKVEDLQNQLNDCSAEIRQWEAGVKRADTSIANADKSVQKLTIAQNESKAAMGRMKGELDGLNSKVEQHRAKLQSASAALKDFSDMSKQAGDRQIAAGKALSKGSAAIVAAGVTAAGTAISWEDSFAGVQKTVSGTEEQLRGIETALMDMSKVKPIENTVLAGIAADAGQLGIQTPNIVKFTDVMADISNTTNLTAEEGASNFAKFANITGMAQGNFDRLGSTVVELGNNMATTERDIVAMGTNLASAGHQIGLTEAEIMGMGATLSSLGLEAQAGGTAFSKMFVNMKVAVETGSAELNQFAEIAGMSAQGFKTAFEQDAAGAIGSFIEGLSSGSKSTIVMLDEMGIKETRFRDALLRTSNASGLLKSGIDMANRAWAENNALANEASVRYGTTASKISMAGNKAKAAAINFGKDLLPAIADGVDWVGTLLEKFNALDAEQRQQIMTWAAYAAAVGPAIMLIGKANTGIASVTGLMSKLTASAAAAGGGLKGFGAALSGLLGPAGVAALAAGLAVGAYKFLDWATGAKAAQEATEDMLEVAKRMKEEQAETIYDTGTSDPLARFGLSADGFKRAAQDSESWLDDLKKVWSDGEKETSETVQGFVDGFTGASDDVRSAIEGRSGMLEGLGALSPEMKAQMDADLKKLDAWDQEVTDLLKKRQNGTLTEEDQARLNEVIQLRAELQLSYTGENGNSFDQVLTGMRAEIARTLSSGEQVDASVYGDALNALAEGRTAYMDSIQQSYDAQFAEIQIIEDEAARTQALAALNAQYNQQRLEGEAQYQQAVKEAATAAFENGGFEEQIGQIDELASLLGNGNVDLTQLADWTGKIDEGKMASMLALVEQLKASGASDSELAEMGIDADDLLSKIQQIRDITANLEGGEGLNSIFSEALPEEIQRVLVGLDMTQAAADWEAFMEGKDSFETQASISLNPLDQQAISTWESQNSDIELTGPAVKLSVALGAGWAGQIKERFDAGLLEVYGTDGAKLEITPDVLKQIDASDVAAVDADGTLHVIITPDVGTPEGLEQTGTHISEKPLEGTAIEFMSGGSIGDQVETILAAADAVEEYRQRIEALNGTQFEEGIGGLSRDELQSVEQSSVGALTDQLMALDQMDLEAIGGRVANLMAALQGGDLSGEAAEQAKAELQGYLDLISAADQYMGIGNQVSAGIGQGMAAYGFTGDAASVKTAIQSALNAAMGIASPATTMIPTGGYVSAGVGQGMREYDFAADAAGVTQKIVSGFATLPTQGQRIGSQFGAGLQRGLQSRMRSTLSLARSYAAQITKTFRDAWQIRSPSHVAEGLTDMFGRGLEKGMRHWPKVSEHVLENDIAFVHGNLRRTAETVDMRAQTYNQQRTVNLNVAQMSVRDQQDVNQLAREITALERKSQRGKGKR